MFQRTRTSKDRLESSATTKDDAAATTTSILQTMGCQAQLGEALLSSDGSVARRLLALTFSRGPSLLRTCIQITSQIVTLRGAIHFTLNDQIAQELRRCTTLVRSI